MSETVEPHDQNEQHTPPLPEPMDETEGFGPAPTLVPYHNSGREINDAQPRPAEMIDQTSYLSAQQEQGVARRIV